jgi:Asp-tRNA(Asn)/Glu-tRNA(Gln) amidotransferase A subunit family amidase
MSAHPTAYDRRSFVSYFGSIGLGGTLLPGVLWAQQQQQPGPITKEMIAQAETVAGLTFTDAERESMAQGEPATPVSISFVGKLYGDADVLLVAKAFQDATDFHKRKPPLFV